MAGIDQSEASSTLLSSPRRCKDIDIDALQCGAWLTKNNLTRAFNKLNKFSQNETLIKVEASFKPNANKKTDGGPRSNHRFARSLLSDFESTNCRPRLRAPKGK